MKPNPSLLIPSTIPSLIRDLFNKSHYHTSIDEYDPSFPYKLSFMLISRKFTFEINLDCINISTITAVEMTKQLCIQPCVIGPNGKAITHKPYMSSVLKVKLRYAYIKRHLSQGRS